MSVIYHSKYSKSKVNMPLTALCICKERPKQWSAVTSRKVLLALNPQHWDQIVPWGLFLHQNYHLLQIERRAGQTAKQKDSHAVSQIATVNLWQWLSGSVCCLSPSLQAQQQLHPSPGCAWGWQGAQPTSMEQSFLPPWKCLAPSPLVPVPIQLVL